MSKVLFYILSSIVGGFAAVGAMVVWFGWGLPTDGQVTYVTASRADYVDLLLTISTIFLGAIGLTLTVGALVIGLVAFKTLREIKDEAASEAKNAAAGKISETMASELEPNVDAKVKETLPVALKTALLEDETGQELLSKLARTGALDDVVERVMSKINFGGPEMDPSDVVDGGDQE